MLRTLAPLIMAGAIANALAAKDPDIEAALLAYDEKQFPDAVSALDRAVKRRGDRPEIALDQGLVRMALEDQEGARKAFERASEASEDDLRASAWFELGNLAFDQESWDQAIEHYVACLTDAPNHEDAKWNLELALTRKEEQQKEQDKKNQENQDEESKDEEKEEDKEEQEEKKEEEEEKEKEEEKDPSDEDEGSSSSSGEGSQSQEGQGSSSTGDEDQTGSQENQGSSEAQDQSSTQDQGQNTGEDSSEQQQPPPQQPQQPPGEPKSNLDRALEDLDRADPFMFGVPKRTRRPVKEDW